MKPSIHNLLLALNSAYDDEPQMLEDMGFEEPFLLLEARLKDESPEELGE